MRKAMTLLGLIALGFTGCISEGDRPYDKSDIDMLGPEVKGLNGLNVRDDIPEGYVAPNGEPVYGLNGAAVRD